MTMLATSPVPRRPIGRPRRTDIPRMIAFRVDAEMYREVEAAARRDERAMAQFVRRVLNEYLTATGQKG